METYACKKCGMSVNATCGKCGIPLKNGHITLDDGTQVQVSKCQQMQRLHGLFLHFQFRFF